MLTNESVACAPHDAGLESPAGVRMSLAAAMTLGFAPGSFYRGARLFCINLLLTYKSGCAGRCAYCGLSRTRGAEASEGGKSFIRVPWPVLELDKVVGAIRERADRVKRVCISMVTNRRAVQDTATICAQLRAAVDVPVSLLIAPTIVTKSDLLDFRAAGADKIGVAIDLATPELFDRYRGAGVGGPHVWNRYWDCLQESLDVFGQGMAGSHFMVGMGETEQEMCQAMQRVRNMGGFTHLFSFFPEGDSPLSGMLPPPIDQYRRIQLARWLIDAGRASADSFVYSERGQIEGYGMAKQELDAIVSTGEPFRTSGCTGRDGEVACNRPYANWRPGPGIRNYPFKPEAEDIGHIRRQLGLAILQ